MVYSYQQNYTLLYTVGGFLFGLCFPIGGILADMLVFKDIPLSWSGVVRLHLENPIHFIIDSAPLVLGAAFCFTGVAMDKIKMINQSLESTIASRTRDLSEKNQELQAIEEELRQNLDMITAMKDDLGKRHSELEEKTRKMQQSISTARRIQKVLMPDQLQMHTLLPQHLLIYWPRDGVSGDFYCVVKQNYRLFIAVADCTGHGVPGALISVLGMEEFHKALLTRETCDPSEILEKIDAGLRKSLQNNNDDARKVQEGMDIGLCVIDQYPPEIEAVLGAPKIRFSGANQKLLIFSEGQSELIAGDKRPIGGWSRHSEKAFSTYTRELKKGTRLYMFTDGFQDQFGGAENRKFLFRNLASLLHQVHELPFESQKHVLQEKFNDWKGEHSQIDDVTLLGFEL